MTNFEQQIAEILDMPCTCTFDVGSITEIGYTCRRLLRTCPECLPKRIAAAIHAAWVVGDYHYDSNGDLLTISEGEISRRDALCALKGEPLTAYAYDSTSHKGENNGTRTPTGSTLLRNRRRVRLGKAVNRSRKTCRKVRETMNDQE